MYIGEVSCRGVYELWGQGQTYSDVMEDINRFRDANPATWNKALAPETSFKFTMDSFGRSPSIQEQIEKFEKFSWIQFQGPVKLTDPDATFLVSENVGLGNRNAVPKWIYFGRHISHTRRDIVDQFSLKKRVYLCTTSMEAEISFLSANQGKVGPDSLVFDPFVGSGTYQLNPSRSWNFLARLNQCSLLWVTGSLLVSCAAFGGNVIGGDIDIQVLRGKEPGKNIQANFAQYGITNKLMGLVRFDSSQGQCLRFENMLDAIVCDRT